jgi:hypothetical protein
LESPNAPVEEQQAEPESLEQALSEEFDRQEAEEVEEHDDAEVEVSSENDQEETEDNAEPEEGTEEVNEAAEDAGVEDYNEPAPERWPEEIKEVYNNLPPAARKAMLDGIYRPMQAKYTQTTQELAQQRKQLDPMLQTLEQHAEQFRTAGINPVEAFQRQMAWSAHFAKVGPEQGAADLAKAYGQSTGQHKTPEEQVYMTPVEKAQQAEIDRLKGEFSNLSKSEQQRQELARQQAFEARQNDVRTSISRFANETRDGQPLHPHVEKVSARMAGLIKGGLVNRTDEYGQPVPYEQQLGQAYKMACEMDPSIRNARNTRTRRQQVDKVSAASRDVVSKTPGHPEIQDDGPLSDTISDLYDKLDRSAA